VSIRICQVRIGRGWCGLTAGRGSRCSVGSDCVRRSEAGGRARGGVGSEAASNGVRTLKNVSTL
jgi:hypothetical protein